MTARTASILSRQVEIQKRIRERLRGQIYELRVVFRGDGIVLRGRAPCYYAKQLAQQAVMESTSLRIVANEIQVR